MMLLCKPTKEKFKFEFYWILAQTLIRSIMRSLLTDCTNGLAYIGLPFAGSDHIYLTESSAAVEQQFDF